MGVKWQGPSSKPDPYKNFDPGTMVFVTKLPDCDLCKLDGDGSHRRPAQYDGKTQMGPWAFMCPEHFERSGSGLGVGFGQQLVLKKGWS